MNIVGFTKEEAEYFGNIVAQMMRSKEARKMAKPKKEKKAPKMKRALLLIRILDYITTANPLLSEIAFSTLKIEGEILLTELRRVGYYRIHKGRS